MQIKDAAAMARRGELFMTVAIDYVRVNRMEKDPDRRVVEAIALVLPSKSYDSAMSGGEKIPRTNDTGRL